MTRRDKLWSVLMLIGIILAFKIPDRFGVIQAAMCGWSLGLRFPPRRPPS